MWNYIQRSGRFYHEGKLLVIGYAGNGKGLNNPAMQTVQKVGPVCVGKYTIGPFGQHPGKGPVVAHLFPDPDNTMHGRDGFLIHGDNSKGDRSASEGCIILPRFAREAVRDSGDTRLTVFSEEQDLFNHIQKGTHA